MSCLPDALKPLAAVQGHMVVVTDAQGLTVWVSDTFTQCTGYTLDDLAGRKPGHLLQGPDTDPAAIQALRLAEAEGRGSQAIELLNHRKDGSPLWLTLDIAPVHDAQGRLTHFFSIQSDTSSRHAGAEGSQEPVRFLQDMLLIGFWDIDLASGAYQCDKVCRHLWGLADGVALPTLAEAAQRLSAADRAELARCQAEIGAGAGRGHVSCTLDSVHGQRHLRAVWQRRAQMLSGVLLDTSSEHALSADHARLLQTLSLAAPAARLAFWRHDLASKQVQWMPAGQHPFGPRFNALSHADDFLERVLPQDRPAVLAAREQAQRGLEVVELEYRMRDDDGAERHVLTRRLGVPGSAGRPAEVIGVCIDVTLQREREALLQRLGQQQQLALQALRAGCFRYDLGASEFRFDAAMLRLYGLPPEAANQSFAQWLTLVHEDDQPQVRERAMNLFASPHRAPTVRFRLRRPGGQLLWLETDRVPEHDTHGRIVALVGTHRDVTEEVAASELSRAVDDARLVSRTRAELLATLAHELRTPLNAVTGFAQLLLLGRTGSRPDSDVVGPARQIQRAGAMMTRLIDDLSDLADADAGALRWQADRVAARSVVDDCIAWLELRDPSAGHRIDNDIPADGATLWADATRVRQILLNLLGNALKYSDGRVSVTARTDGAQMCLTVHDEGPGLDAVQIQRAFEPFERLGQERGPQVGSGLGLAVCRRLTRLMGGDVEVSSTPGAGSAFTIVLPRADPPARP